MPSAIYEKPLSGFGLPPMERKKYTKNVRL
jgi:hypothetical protein